MTAVCWYGNWDSDSDSVVLAEFDAPADQFTTMSTGHLQSCAIRVDGTLACWPCPLEPEDLAGS